ncbi:MAG: hypothetical protein CL927_18220 [Deltaproteobacteria bacterium]|nr:hypothetical protein [Deltaproteobacteria bacterium]HCH65587.1 hypothetical protein [Deltaproteobacteria bacterium]
MHAMKLSQFCLLSLLWSCGSESGKPGSADDSVGLGADVSERLSDGEARAGVVRSSDALFGGASAEGALGDFKLYNSKVQFIIQDIREGDYYEALGGSMIDADIVRPVGVPGRDAIDESLVMGGFGLICDPTSITVVADGSDGQAAVVRVEGVGTPMTLVTGVLESDALVTSHSLDIRTDYILAPDSHLVELVTTVTWRDEPHMVQMGDIFIVGMEVVDSFMPGRGLDDGAEAATGEWVGAMGHSAEVALAMFSTGDAFSGGNLSALLSEIGPILVLLQPTVELSDGETNTFRRLLGVGPALSTLTDEWHLRQGHTTTTVGGVVTANDAPLPGARVHLMDGEAFETVALTDRDGRWSAQVTAESPLAVASGRGHAEWVDLPPGAGWVAPYSAPEVAAFTLDTLVDGAEPIPFAEGYGVSEAIEASSATAHALTAPGTLSVSISDGGPAVVRVDFADGDPVTTNPAVVPGRPGGAAVVGYVRDGSIDIPVEPGEYTVTVHRGLRHEAYEEEVFIQTGVATSVVADLPLAVEPSGFLTLDPHSHASPSVDGKIGMAHRMVTMAANGVQVHIGTDHDHVADYRPLLEPLGLEEVLTSVVADEASPVLRGHTNIFPVSLMGEEPNQGAPRWWEGITDTTSWFADIRAWAGPDAIIQLNHPAGLTGMLGAASYSLAEGAVRKPDHFAEDFQAMEVLNDGRYGAALELYLDLIGRGYSVTPTGVSDSHSYRGGLGSNLTWAPVGVDAPASLTDAALARAIREGQTIVSQGPFLDVRVDGTWAPGLTFTGAKLLDVSIVAPSYVQVDTLVLLENGIEVDRVETSTDASFALSPLEDAHYVVMASGSNPMWPVYDETPWAMAAAIKIDVEGDGWEPPLPPLGMGR